MRALPEYSTTTLDVVHHADALAWLQGAPSEWVHCVITSPPYFALRAYSDGDPREIGLEPSPQAYVNRLVGVFREVKRVLRADGVAFVNLGDSFMPDKNLALIPWRFALAMQAAGWILRSAAPWLKRNAQPESVTDRPVQAVEYLLMFSQTPQYWYDHLAVRQQASPASLARIAQRTFDQQTGGAKDYGHGTNVNRSARKALENFAANPGRNRRNSDWYFEGLDEEIERLRALRDRGGVRVDARGEPLAFDITTEPSALPHYAMMPRKLVEPLILAGCPAQACSACGAPYERIVQKPDMRERPTRSGGSKMNTDEVHLSNNWQGYPKSAGQAYQEWRNANPDVTVGWQPACECDVTLPPSAGIVLDPFGGAGTTGLEAQKQGRHYVLIDLTREYVELARQRLRYGGDDRRLVAEEAAGVEQLSLF